MNGVIARQEAEEYQAETDRLASKAKRAAYAKLREDNPDFDMQRAAAIARKVNAEGRDALMGDNKSSPKPFPTDPKFGFNTVRMADFAKAAKGSRIVRPPPQKKLPSTLCPLCGAKVSDIRQHKHDVHNKIMYATPPVRVIKESVWVPIYEGGAPGLGKRHS
ncbi:MAG: hypothetical protein ACXW11_00110 [Methylotenera sp.]